MSRKKTNKIRKRFKKSSRLNLKKIPYKKIYLLKKSWKKNL